SRSTVDMANTSLNLLHPTGPSPGCHPISCVILPFLLLRVSADRHLTAVPVAFKLGDCLLLPTDCHGVARRGPVGRADPWAVPAESLRGPATSCSGPSTSPWAPRATSPLLRPSEPDHVRTGCP